MTPCPSARTPIRPAIAPGLPQGQILPGDSSGAGEVWDRDLGWRQHHPSEAYRAAAAEFSNRYAGTYLGTRELRALVSDSRLQVYEDPKAFLTAAPPRDRSPVSHREPPVAPALGCRSRGVVLVLDVAAVVGCDRVHSGQVPRAS
ncbi:hypothetical protein ACFVT5_37315 [Streptomyces sp. NPDC058001]|uniref:hypothetical protein n=1 Tax=Streptomyces sp. NPDC058001 TaxID=3346300 RepID=UPI0036EC75F4